MLEGLLNEAPLGAIFVTLAAASLASARIGNTLGQRARETSSERARSQVTTAQAAVFGLLALLLAFTFSMSATRFDTRKQLVLQEANAVGTAYLRADLLAEPAREQSRRLLSDYVDARLAFAAAGTNSERVAETLRRTEALQQRLWTIAVAEMRRETQPVAVALYLTSLNETIDLHSKRAIALADHVPSSILWILFVVTILSMLCMGYGNGLDGEKYRFSTVTTAILLTVVIVLIVDLDRPRRGLIDVSQASMETLKAGISRGAKP